MVFEVHPVGIENEFPLVSGDVVKDGHLLVADHYKALFLERMEPAYEDMSSPLVSETQTRDCDVRKVRRQVAPSTSRHLDRRAAEDT